MAAVFIASRSIAMLRSASESSAASASATAAIRLRTSSGEPAASMPSNESRPTISPRASSGSTAKQAQPPSGCCEESTTAFFSRRPAVQAVLGRMRSGTASGSTAVEEPRSDSDPSSASARNTCATPPDRSAATARHTFERRRCSGSGWASTSRTRPCARSRSESRSSRWYSSARVMIFASIAASRVTNSKSSSENAPRRRLCDRFSTPSTRSP
jgi:hypothetical protein